MVVAVLAETALAPKLVSLVELAVVEENAVAAELIALLHLT